MTNNSGDCKESVWSGDPHIRCLQHCRCISQETLPWLRAGCKHCARMTESNFFDPGFDYIADCLVAWRKRCGVRDVHELDALIPISQTEAKKS